MQIIRDLIFFFTRKIVVRIHEDRIDEITVQKGTGKKKTLKLSNFHRKPLIKQK